MNRAATTEQHAEDYRASMQQAARGFIDRHQAEHLQDDGLFARTVRYLVNTLEVPAFMADRLVHLAMSERLPQGKALASVNLSTGMVLDNRTGQCGAPPPRTLPGRFQASPNTR